MTKILIFKKQILSQDNFRIVFYLLFFFLFALAIKKQNV